MIFLFVCLVFVFLLMYGIEIQPSNGVSECWDAGLAGEYGEDSGGNYGSTQLILGIYILATVSVCWLYSSLLKFEGSREYSFS